MTGIGIGLMALLAWGVLLFGAVYPWAYWPLFVGSLAIGITAALRGRAWRDPRLVHLTVALGVLAAVVVLETIALPSWLIARLSPSVDVFLRQFEVGYHPARLRTLSLAPHATFIVLAELVAFSLLLIGVTRALRRMSLEWLVVQILGLAVSVAVIGIVQKALIDPDVPLLYGFWRPRQGGNPFGPFVNRNHFAGWMIMVLPVVAAYGWSIARLAEGVDHRSTREWLRWSGSLDGNRLLLVLSAVFIMGVALIFTGSRSGMAGFAVGVLVLGWFLLRESRGRARWVAAAALVSLMAGAVSWAGSDLVVSRFQRAGSEFQGRLAAWKDTARIVGDFPVFGTGLGGYRRAMLVYQSDDREKMYAQAHNDYLQLVAEGGLVVSAAAAAVIGVFAFGVWRRLVSGDDDAVAFWVRRGAVAGLMAIAAQSLVEFSLQMPGNAVMFVTLAAIALHRPRPHSHAYRV